MKLLINALIKLLCGIALLGVLVFLPAGTLNYIDGWNLLIILFVPILIMGTVLFIKAPELLKKRLNGKEKQATQRGVVGFSALIFLAVFIIAGLDYRFSWTRVPLTVKIVSVILFLASYAIYAEVMRENAFLSRTIEVQENQVVVDTGLYGIIRHPMYAATIILFLSMPLILGSWIAFIVMLMYPLIIAIRILNEEKVLSEQLEGYVQYKQKVKYRIMPFIW